MAHPGRAEPSATAATVCYRHPNRETAVSCAECGRPICPDCMVYSPVGIKCPECARQPRSALVRMKPNRAVGAVGAAAGVGALMGLGIVVLQGFGLFFALLWFLELKRPLRTRSATRCPA